MSKTEIGLVRVTPRLSGAAPLHLEEKARWDAARTRRLIAGLVYGCLTVAVFSPVLVSLTYYALRTDLHSHIVLVPFVSVWLIYLIRGQLPRNYETSAVWAVVGFAIAGAALFAGLMGADGGVNQEWSVSYNDYLALMAFSLVCFIWSGGFLFFGRRWMTVAAFPMVFLLFLIPLPDNLVHVLERCLMMASAEAADLFFDLAGTPHLRHSLVFQLPNISIQVAQECSGIRSSWVLFITGTLASYLFLRSSWRRTALVGLIIPLGIIRNGFRIFVIGVLCIDFGPQMIHSAIHRSGGPLFFAMSLIPLFVLLYWMRRIEQRSRLPDR